MNRACSYLLLILQLPILLSCNLDPLEQDQLERFDKLYALSENVRAIDFICKPDQSGYLIIGNQQSNDNSDIIIIDVNSDGVQKKIHRIRTPYFDEAASAKFLELDNSVYILVNRKMDAMQSSADVNMLIKTNINGEPVKADDSTDTISAEFKVLNVNSNSITELRDFLILPPNLIAIGSIKASEEGLTSRITKIFEFNSVNFNSKKDSIFTQTGQKPENIIYNGSSNLCIRPGSFSSAVYEVIEQNFSENPFGSISGSSQNITWNIYTDVASSSSQRVFLGTDKNEQFGDILHHSNGKKYIAGNYSGEDSVFLISKEYTGLNNNRDQEIYVLAGLGNKVSSLTETENGMIIMALVDEKELVSNASIAKFSQAGRPIKDENIVFKSTGVYDIVKIESEPNNIVTILSQKTFDNNATAIGLKKIIF